MQRHNRTYRGNAVYYLYNTHEIRRFSLYQTSGVASAGFGVPISMTFSCVALFPFSAGKSKASLWPPFRPFHLPNPFPSSLVHVSAPTQGCTFHPSSNVTFPCEANRPVISVIWYLGLEFLSLTMPGVGSGSGSGAFFLLDGFDFLVGAFFVPTIGRSFQASKGVYGFNWLLELIMVSQMMACEDGAVGEEEG